MLKGLINRTRGQVRLRVTCPYPERVLNLCSARNLAFWDLEWEGENQFTCRVSRQDFRVLRQNGEKLDCEFHVLGREGAPYALGRLRRRQALAAGLLLWGVWLVLSSVLIWDIRITGNETVPKEEILRSLEKNGVRRGTWGLSVNGEDIRNHMLLVPECINECSGIRIFGRTIKSFIFSTDVATIASCNADAVIAVYPFTPQPRIVRAIISVADTPVFCGVGGGFTSGARSVAQAMEAEHCGAYGVVLNAPVSADILRDIKAHIDIPVVATIVSATQDTEARIAAGVDILNVSAASETPQLVAALRERHPEIPIIATGGPKDETIRKTIAAGANAITYTPPDNGVLLADIMTAHRERYR